MRRSAPELVAGLTYRPASERAKSHAEARGGRRGDRTRPAAADFVGVEKVDFGRGDRAEDHQGWAGDLDASSSPSSLLLLAASGLLIANTISLSIFARRREIEVMKLVGASNWFVRGPFMLEGCSAGLAGATLAVILLLARQGDRAAGDPRAPSTPTPTFRPSRSR